MKKYRYYLRLQDAKKKWHSSPRYNTLKELMDKYCDWIQEHTEYPFQIIRESYVVKADNQSND